jgi:hypothetical protein
MVDLGEISHSIGTNYVKTTKRIHIHQQIYI